MFWNEAWFDRLSQLFAPFEKFVILSRKKPWRTFQPQALKNKNIYAKKISYFLGQMVTKRKFFYTPLYSKMATD